MPKGKNQKLRLYRLYRIMLNETDEEHGLTIREIKDRLEDMDVTVDRKTLYEDFEALDEMDLEVQMVHAGNEYEYRVISKPFDLAELKLLVDAVQSSKFITAGKSKQLIDKLTGFASRYEANELKRQVVVTGRVKTMNESIYYNVDTIHRAMYADRQISFTYLQWNMEKKLVPREDHPYQVSPWALTWDQENYYLIAYDDKAGIIKNYRVDKMNKIIISDEKRTGRNAFAKVNMAVYTKEQFGMYHGELVHVTLQFDNSLTGVLIDRFGKDILIRRIDENHSETSVQVNISNNFFGWITGLGAKIRITSPDAVVEQYKAELLSVLKQYS